jgi:hypothetical protein
MFWIHNWRHWPNARLKVLNLETRTHKINTYVHFKHRIWIVRNTVAASVHNSTCHLIRANASINKVCKIHTDSCPDKTHLYIFKSQINMGFCHNLSCSKIHPTKTVGDIYYRTQERIKKITSFSLSSISQYETA